MIVVVELHTVCCVYIFSYILSCLVKHQFVVYVILIHMSQCITITIINIVINNNNNDNDNSDK